MPLLSNDLLKPSITIGITMGLYCLYFEYQKIQIDIEKEGFKNAALIHSISNSSTVGGEIGWFDKNSLDFTQLEDVLKGNTSIMFAEEAKAPASVIKTFRKKSEKPLLKAALVEEEFYIGDDNLSMLAQLKSKNELIGDIITLLQSPAKNVISSLQSSSSKLSGIVKTLSERKE